MSPPNPRPNKALIEAIFIAKTAHGILSILTDMGISATIEATIIWLINGHKE
jgi:hypothetical protein